MRVSMVGADHAARAVPNKSAQEAGAGVERELVRQCPACRSADQEVYFAPSDVVQCQSCDVLYISPRPTPSAIAQFYSQAGRYEHWDLQSGRTEMWKRRLARVRKHAKSGRLLDVGTGQGDFGAFAKAHFGFEGTEVSRGGAQQARTRHGVVVHEGDLLELALSGDSYDVITLWHVLEHVGEPGALIKECVRLLKPNGVVVIAVPNADYDLWLTRRFLDGALQFAIGRPPRRSVRLPGIDFALRVATGRRPIREIGIPRLTLASPEEELHLTHFTLKTLAHLVQLAGLRVVEEGLDDYSAEANRDARMQHYRERAFFRLTGLAAAPAILLIARKPT